MTYRYLCRFSLACRWLQLVLLFLFYTMHLSNQTPKSANDLSAVNVPFSSLRSPHYEPSPRTSLDLQCPPCERIHCAPRRAAHLKCKGGLVRGVCNCCPVCARTEGETCGGQWNYLGRCDEGLACEPHSNHVINDWVDLRPAYDHRGHQRHSEYGNRYSSERQTESSSSEGICRKGTSLILKLK